MTPDRSNASAVGGPSIPELAVREAGSAHLSGQFLDAMMVAIGAGLLLLPALLAMHPFYFYDTPTFFNWGHDIVAAIAKPWPSLDHFPSDRGMWAGPWTDSWRRVTPAQFQLLLTEIGARSEFYAVAYYLIAGTFGQWAMPIVQCTLASAVIYLAFRVILPQSRRDAYVLIISALTLLTPVGIYSAFLMPDFLIALGVISAGLLLFYYRELKAIQKIFCSVVLFLTVVVHTSNFAVLFLMLATGVILGLLSRSERWAPGAIRIGASVACGLVALALSHTVIGKVFGQPLHTAPFLEGRVIADGPGQLFLRESCKDHPYIACRFKDLNVDTPDDVIWAQGNGDFPVVVDVQKRRRFMREQWAIVLGTIKHHPLWQAMTSTRNALRQIADFGLRESIVEPLPYLLREGSDRGRWALSNVPNTAPCMGPSLECGNSRTFRYFQAAHYAAIAVAFLWILVVLVKFVREDGRWRSFDDIPSAQRRLLMFALLMVFTTLANGVVCGVLSGPYDRYQARIVWVVPLAAILLGVLANRRRSETAPD